MKRQTIFFILGIIFLFAAILCITILPAVLKNLGYANNIKDYILTEFEFLFMAFCFIFYLFSTEYFKQQILTILAALFFYIVFVRIYPILL